MDFIKKCTDLHLSQTYGSQPYDIPYDLLMNRYSSTPLETTYIVDCKTFEVKNLNKNIATELSISLHTVSTHRKNIIVKLETSGSIAAFNKAKDIGIL